MMPVAFLSCSRPPCPLCRQRIPHRVVRHAISLRAAAVATAQIASWLMSGLKTCDRSIPCLPERAHMLVLQTELGNNNVTDGRHNGRRAAQRARALPASSSTMPLIALASAAPLPSSSSPVVVPANLVPEALVEPFPRDASTPIIDQAGSGTVPTLAKPRSKRGELPCFNWQRTKACPKGNKCWYSHDPAVRSWPHAHFWIF
jgi:hypothetical protein